MARYIVVEFQDNVDAAKFIKETWGQNQIDRSARRPFRRRIVGVFVPPGIRCKCGDWNLANIRNPDKVGNKGAGITRGEKFGWWVCTRCKKPRMGSHQLVNQVTLSELYEGPTHEQPSGTGTLHANTFEVQVDTLSITGIATQNIDRPKNLRRKKAKKAKK